MITTLDHEEKMSYIQEIADLRKKLVKVENELATQKAMCNSAKRQRDQLLEERELPVTSLLHQIEKLERKDEESNSAVLRLDDKLSKIRDCLDNTIGEDHAMLEKIRKVIGYYWKCPHCASEEGTWFDRSLDEHGDMHNVCESCGKNVD